MLNVRTEGNEDAPVIGALEEGDQAEVIEDYDGGAFVRVCADADTYGYVSADYVELATEYPTGRTLEQIAAEEEDAQSAASENWTETASETVTTDTSADTGTDQSYARIRIHLIQTQTAVRFIRILLLKHIPIPLRSRVQILRRRISHRHRHLLRQKRRRRQRQRPAQRSHPMRASLSEFLMSGEAPACQAELTAPDLPWQFSLISEYHCLISPLLSMAAVHPSASRILRRATWYSITAPADRSSMSRSMSEAAVSFTREEPVTACATVH